MYTLKLISIIIRHKDKESSTYNTNGEDLYKTEKISHKSPGKCTSE